MSSRPYVSEGYKFDWNTLLKNSFSFFFFFFFGTLLKNSFYICYPSQITITWCFLYLRITPSTGPSSKYKLVFGNKTLTNYCCCYCSLFKISSSHTKALQNYNLEEDLKRRNLNCSSFQNWLKLYIVNYLYIRSVLIIINISFQLVVSWVAISLYGKYRHRSWKLNHLFKSVSYHLTKSKWKIWKWAITLF